MKRFFILLISSVVFIAELQAQHNFSECSTCRFMIKKTTCANKIACAECDKIRAAEFEAKQAEDKKIPPKVIVKTDASVGTKKYGALAIDRTNGYYYGWSYDYTSLAEAEQKAIDECNKKGGNCSVVLSYSGTGCAAYRTIDGNVGTAFGWGLAKTKEEADAIATKECLKRSNGTNPANFVWSCNAANTGVLKEIYNANGEIFQTVKIGKQVWAAENLNTLKFKNNDPITVVKTHEEWKKLCIEKKPACMDISNFPGEANCGIIYNLFAVNDSRGLGFNGWQIPTKDDWEQLISYVGGERQSGAELASNDYLYTNGNNSLGFNGRPCSDCSGCLSTMQTSYGYGKNGIWWSSTQEEGSSNFRFGISSYGSHIIGEILGPPIYIYGTYVRLIKD
jgi:uncharacterized protein (TIGR02145 family)